MNLSKKNRKTIAGIINNAKEKAVENYAGIELIAAYTVINHIIQESFIVELLKDHDIKTVEEFLQDCTMMEDETTE